MLKEDIILICIVGGAIILWMLLIAFFAEREKRSGRCGRFDERQLVAQGTAFKWAFITTAVYFVADAILSDVFGIVWYEPPIGNFFGLIAGTAVFCVLCILQDAYIRPTDSKTLSLVSINLIAVSQLGLYFSNYRSEPPVQDGKLMGSSIFLMFFFMAVLVDLTFFVKARMDKRAEQEKDDEESEA